MPATLSDGALDLTLSDPLAIDTVLGSSYDDTIIGNTNDNTLIGGGGDDLLVGLGGNNLIEGSVTRTIYLDFNSMSSLVNASTPEAELQRDPGTTKPITPTSRTSSPRHSRSRGRTHRSISTTRCWWASREESRPGSTGGIWTSQAPRHSPPPAWTSSRLIPPGSTSTTSWAVPASLPPRAPTSSGYRPRSPRTSWGISPAWSTPTRTAQSARESTRGSTRTSTIPPIPDQRMPPRRSWTSWPPAPR